MKTSFGSYKRVMMLGIDGMGAFNAMTSTPHMDELFKDGATTYKALAARPTISGQCWTTMLTGAIPSVHGLSNSCMHPIENLPTIFGIIRKAMPDVEMAAFTDWSPIAREIISPTGGADHLDWGNDDELNERILAYLDDHDPTMLFIQYDSVDGAGHHGGYGFQEHLERITHVDAMLGKLVDKYKERGFFDDTLFIVTADHGGTPQHGHGGWSDGERFVFLGVAGKNVQSGTISTVSMRDFPAIVLWALGVNAPEFNPKGYASQMPVGIFPDAGVKQRVELFSNKASFETKPEPKEDDKGYIGCYLNKDKILMDLNFENGCQNAIGPAKIEQNTGFVKLYSNGVHGMCGEFGNGSLKVTNVHHGKVFSIMLWHIIDSKSTGWIDLFSTRDNVHRSFTIAAIEEGMGIFLKEPDQKQTYRLDLLSSDGEVLDTANQWCHYLYVIDTENNIVKGYTDFENEKILKIDAPIVDYFQFDSLYLGLEQASPTTYKMVDDMMIVDGEVDIEALKKYYNAK